jgi:hypothetical protein
VEPYNQSLQDKEYRFFFKYVEGGLKKMSMATTKLESNGMITIKSHFGY